MDVDEALVRAHLEVLLESLSLNGLRITQYTFFSVGRGIGLRDRRARALRGLDDLGRGPVHLLVVVALHFDVRIFCCATCLVCEWVGGEARLALLEDLRDDAGLDVRPPSRIAKRELLVHGDRLDELDLHVRVAWA